MKLSVILACYNGADTLADQLDGLAAQEWSEPWEIIFLDNRSTDNSRAIAEQYQQRLPNLKIIDASEQQSKAFALNKGVLASQGDSLAFVDDDDQVAPGWLSAMGEALETHDLVACRWDIDTLNSGWVRQTRTINYQSDGVYDPIHYPPYLPHAGGNSIGSSRELYNRIGGFDESLPNLDDTDYVWRAQLAGAQFFFVRDAVVRIRFRQDMRGLYRQFRSYAENNVLLSKRYRSYGEPMPHPWRKYFSKWLQLAPTWKRLKRLRRKPERGKWVIKFGWQVGLTRGILKYRVPPV